MPDINQLWEQAKGMSIEQLSQAIAGKFPTMPASIAAPALMAKKQLADAAKLEQGAKTPKTTVLSDLEKEMSGVGSLAPGALAPQPMMPQLPAQRDPAFMNQLMQQQPQSMLRQTQGQPQLEDDGTHAYAKGGIVALSEDGDVPDPWESAGRTVRSLPRRWWEGINEGIDSALPLPLRVLKWGAPRLGDAVTDAAGRFGRGFAQGDPTTGDVIPVGRGMGPEDFPPEGNPNPWVPAPESVRPQSGEAPRLRLPASVAGGGQSSGQGIESMMQQAMMRSGGVRNQIDPGWADRENDARVRAGRDIKDFAAERRAALEAQGIVGLPLEKQQAELEQMRRDLAGRQDNRIGQALLQAGLSTMAGKSPYALANIGEGASVGLKQYLESEKLDVADKQKLLQISATIEQAQRAEAIGNVDAAEKAKQEALKLHATMTAHGQSMTASLFHSMMAGELGLQGHAMQARSSAAATASASADRRFIAGESQKDRALERERDTFNRAASLEQKVFADGYERTMKLMEAPQYMTLPPEKKIEYANQGAMEFLKLWRNKDKTPGSQDKGTGRVAGKITPAGELVR